MMTFAAKLFGVFAFVAVVIFVGLVLWKALFPPQHPINHAATTNEHYAQSKSADEDSETRASKIATDEKIADYTLALAVFTALLVLVSAFQIGFLISTDKTANKAASAAKESADVAKGTLVAAQRPWIQIKHIAVTSPLVFEPTPDDHEGRVDLTFIVKNTGNSPAIRIQLNVKLSASNTLDLRAEQRTYAEALKNARIQAEIHPSIIQPEITLFPGEETAIHTVAWMNPEPLAQFRKWASTVPGAILLPAVVGSVFYEFTFAKGHHQTGIIYSLHKATPYPAAYTRASYSTFPRDMPAQNTPGAIHFEGSTAQDDLVLKQPIVGTGPID